MHELFSKQKKWKNRDRGDFKIETTHNKFVVQPPGKLACVLQSPLLAAIVIAAITLAVFIHVLSADFVAWDDDIIIYNNPIIRDLSTAGIGKLFTDVDSMMRYNPLTLLGWSITYHFFGAKPFWYHLGNWLMHGLNASLVFLVLRKLLVLASSYLNRLNINLWRITISAGLAALLWSLHPMRVEPVAWCTDRTYCQALLFLLLTLLFYLRANEPDKSISRHYILLTISVIFYIVSLLSYAIGMTFFFVLIALDIYPLGKLNFGNKWWEAPANRRALLDKIPFAAVAIVIALVTVCIRMASAGVWAKPVTLAKFGLIERFMQAMYIWAYYIWRPWYPVNLAPVYTTLVSFNPLSPVFISSAILVIGIVTLMILLRHRWPLGLALVICYLLLLVPVLGVLEHPHFPCDRYSIIVSILWSVLMAAGLAHPKIKPLPFRISLVLSIIAIATLGLLTFRQTHVWTNSKTLFAHTIKTLNDDAYSSDIYRRLGNVYQLEGNAEEAIRQFENAVRINETFKTSVNQAEICLKLGAAYIQIGKYEPALYNLTKSLDLDPNNVDALNNLAWLLTTRAEVSAEDANKAVGFAEDACKLTEYKKPEFLDTLAVTYAAVGRFDDAVNKASQAIEIAKAHGQKDLALKIQNRLELYRTGRPYREK